MANISNTKVFRRAKECMWENTIIMVYRAERLYEAKGDANKIFQCLSKHIFDTKRFVKIQKSNNMNNHEDYQFLKKRIHGVARLMSQIKNFLD